MANAWRWPQCLRFRSDPEEVVALLKAVLEGTTSRTAAAEWAAEVQENIEDQDAEAVDPAMWHLLRLAASLDVKSGPIIFTTTPRSGEWIEGKA